MSIVTKGLGGRQLVTLGYGEAGGLPGEIFHIVKRFIVSISRRLEAALER